MVNCFFLSKDAIRSARYACDQHAGKIVLELAQVLWSVQRTLRRCDEETQNPTQDTDWLQTAPICASTGKPGYGMVHAKHPFARFASRSEKNYQFLVARGLALAHEHTFRMGTVHSAQAQLEWLRDNPPPQNLFLGADTPPDYPHGAMEHIADLPICVPEDVRDTLSVVKSYRKCYRIKAETFRKPMRWTNRRPPKWLPSVLDNDAFVVVKSKVADGKRVWQVVPRT